MSFLERVLNNEEEQELLKAYLDNIDTRDYEKYRRLMSNKMKVSPQYIMDLNNKINDFWNFDFMLLNNLEEEMLCNYLKLYIDILDELHFKLKEALIILIKKYSIEQLMDDVNLIMKNIRGKLKALFASLDIDAVCNVVYSCYKLYEPEIEASSKF